MRRGGRFGRGRFAAIPITISDSIYGSVQLSDWLTPLLMSPAVQRLRWLSLSNVPSLTYPMISGVTRYAHSLGVSFLAERVALGLGMSSHETKALLCAALLHDAGMPPVGHLTEEAFALYGYRIDHEETLRALLLEEGRIYAQMPDGARIGVSEALYRIGADADLVFDSILGRGPLGGFVRASIDLDNIDNVERIYRLTGPTIGYDPKEVAWEHFVKGNENSKGKWERVRYELYNRLMFSLPDFVLKATTKRLLGDHIRGSTGGDRGAPACREVLRRILLLTDSELLGMLGASMGSEGRSLASGEMDRLVDWGWIENRVSEGFDYVRDEVQDVGDPYYFDHIPDKRAKDELGNFGAGALVGVFCAGSGSRERDDTCVSILRDGEVLPIQGEHSIPETRVQGSLF